MRAALPYGILWMPRAGLDPRLPDQLLLLAFLLHICGRNCMPQEMLVPWISLASSFVCPVCPVIVMAICNFCSWKSLYQRWNSSRQVLFFSRDEMRTRNWTSTNVHTILFQGIPQYIVQNLVRKDCSCRSKGIWSDNDLSATVWELRTFCFSESTWSIQVNWPFWSQLIGVPGYSGVPLITHAVWTLKIPRIRAPLKEIPEAMLPDARFDEAFEDKSGEKDAKGPDALLGDPLRSAFGPGWLGDVIPVGAFDIIWCFRPPDWNYWNVNETLSKVWMWPEYVWLCFNWKNPRRRLMFCGYVWMSIALQELWDPPRFISH